MRALVVSDDLVLTERIQDLLAQEGHDIQVAALGSPHQLAASLPDSAPYFIILALSPDPEKALEHLRAIARIGHPRVLVVGPATEPRIILQSLREGACHYLDETDLEVELATFLRRLRTESERPTRLGKFLAVLGASGGSGSSTLAVNLAVSLAQKHKTCALFDLKPGVGDLAALLDLRPTHTLADLCANVGQFDQTVLDHSLARHESGVALLAPPRRLEDIRLVTPESVKQALQMARSLFPYVVADLDDCFHEEQIQALQMADVILLVLRLDFTSLRNAQRALEALEDLGQPREKIRLVVNRYGQSMELPAKSAEQALKLKIAHYVPDDPKTINRANNSGVPAVLDNPRAKVSRSIYDLAVAVNGAHPAG